MDNHRTSTHEKGQELKILRDMRKNHWYYQEITPAADVGLCISFFECCPINSDCKIRKGGKKCSTKWITTGLLPPQKIFSKLHTTPESLPWAPLGLFSCSQTNLRNWNIHDDSRGRLVSLLGLEDWGARIEGSINYQDSCSVDFGYLYHNFWQSIQQLRYVSMDKSGGLT